ncbi:UNVERIFIED_CONTAM: hypothetical protein Sradi_6442100 [Sesamum radiatum]|uniref:Uncharacterized protein n=1 Tax=Sesamum radiatum TaxID=300843 RepID=A0AAW2K5I5_SESRA
MFFKVASCNSNDEVAVASIEKKTLNPLTNASLALVSQHRLVITPVTITSFTPISFNLSSKPVPYLQYQDSYNITNNLTCNK